MKLYQKLSACETGLTLFLSIALVAVVFFQVLNRTLFKISVTWPEELARYLMVWLVFIANVLAFKRGANVGIDAISAKLHGGAKFALNCFQYLVCAAFASIVALHMAPILLMQISLKQTSPALGINMACVYAAMVVWGVLTLVELVVLFVKSYQEWKEGAVL